MYPQHRGLPRPQRRGDRQRVPAVADRQLVDVRAWLDAYGRILDERLGRLDEFLTETKGEQS